jgi:hypothetical protein
MDSTTSALIGLVILLVIGGFVCFAMFPSRRTPSTQGTTEDTNMLRSTGAIGTGLLNQPSGSDGANSP